MLSALFLTGGVKSYPNISGVQILPIYKGHSKVIRLIRYIHHRTSLAKNWKYFWLGDWKKHLMDYNEIVIEDSLFDYYPLEFIRSLRPDIRLVFCFRNRVIGHIHHSVIQRQPEVLRDFYGCELWSYSNDDCDMYKMNKYNQFHLIPKELASNHPPISQDVYFIGEDKHRAGRILDLKSKLEQRGLTTKICIVPDPKMKYTSEEKKVLSPPQPYAEVLDNILRSRCIIDIVNKVNYGMTYRSLEAAVLKKKLLTNYVEIKEVSFYNKNNIFILGIDDEDNLKDFVLSPFDDSIGDKLDEYSFCSFCKKLFNDFK